ncbi:MAG: hypothetical protein V4489_05290 [Chlamydiota bacterium]
MEALSKVTIQDSLSQNTPGVSDEPKILNKKISRFMMELFEALMPTLQSLAKASREFGVYSYEHFKRTSSSESGNQRNIAFVSLIGISSAFTADKGTIGAVSAVSSSGNAYFQSHLTSASTDKGINQEMLSRSTQDQSTLQNTIEKLLGLVQQVLQTERSSA